MRVLRTSAAALALALVAGCGGGGAGGSQVDTQLVRGPGFVFRAPAGWQVTKTPRSSTTFPEANAPELVSVTRFPLAKPFRVSLWPKVVGELDGIAGRLGSVDSRETVTIAGLRGRRYEMSVESKGASLRQRIAFLLKGRTEYQLLCRWPEGDSEPRACSLLEETFRRA